MPQLGALDGLRTMVNVLREVSLDELRQQAEMPPRLLIVAASGDEARTLGRSLTGLEGEFTTIYRAADEPIDSLGRIDAVVVWDRNRTGAASRVAEALRFESPPVPVVRFEGASTEAREAIADLRSEIVKRNPDRAPAFGRALPAFRPAAAKQVIDETAAANAQFSLVSNIPALIPVIGNIAAAGADFIVLTKNQVMMLYKLAAVFGRNLHDQRGILQEVLPVVGAGLVWRTVAREAAALMPFAAGTVPKVAIAYVGTIAVGRAAEFYYRTGLRPSRSQIEQFYRQGLERLRHLDVPGLRQFLGRETPYEARPSAPQVTVIREDDPFRPLDRGDLN